MSERMMTVAEAREWVAQDKSSRNTVSAARTAVAQAEQIETLSHLLAGAEQAAISRAEQIERLQDYTTAVRKADDWCMMQPDMDEHLLPGDMEPPE